LVAVSRVIESFTGPRGGNCSHGCIDRPPLLPPCWLSLRARRALARSQLDLSSLGLSGALPPSLAALDLSDLNLGRNAFDGPVPPWLLVPTLRALDLGGNQFTSLPPEVGGAQRSREEEEGVAHQAGDGLASRHR
jgi:hypothetical protein